MAQIHPFRGVLYNPEAVKDLAQVVAPPYDVIDPAGQAALLARHPNNVIRLELSQERSDDTAEHNRYTRAATCLREWLRTGALRRDPGPSVYPYSIEYDFSSSDGTTTRRTLQGFLTTLMLEEFGSGQVYPHENTRAAAKADRLELLRTCRANFSPIWGLYSDPDARIQELIWDAVARLPARIDFRDDEGFRQRLWALSDPALLDRLHTLMKQRPVFIADGHHRYETALTYCRLQREQSTASSVPPLRPHDSVLMLLSSLEHEGLTVLPTHRILTAPLPSIAEIRSRLGDTCDIREIPFTGSDESAVCTRFLRELHEQYAGGHGFGLVLREARSFFLLTLRAGHHAAQSASPRERLDVSILHNEILPRLSVNTAGEHAFIYTKDPLEAVEQVRRGIHPAAFLLNPTKVSEVRAVAAAGERMPHKSTYFFPKPLTGLVMNVFED